MRGAPKNKATGTTRPGAGQVHPILFLDRLLRCLFATSMPGRVALWDLSYSPMFFVLIFGVFLFDVAIILYLTQS